MRNSWKERERERERWVKGGKGREGKGREGKGGFPFDGMDGWMGASVLPPWW